MIRPIRKIGDPVLRKKTKRVEKITPELQRLIDDMIETMRAADGLGLAAPQVGVSQRLAVIELEAVRRAEAETEEENETPPRGEVLTLINPEVIKQSEEMWERSEGCLSIPGWYGDVARPLRIVVKATNRNGERFKIEAEGMLARAILHEIDHLDGVLFIDKLVSPERIWRAEQPAQPQSALRTRGMGYAA